MLDLPPEIPEKGYFAGLYAWLNKLRRAVRSLSPLQSDNVNTLRGPHGTFRAGQPGGDSGPGAALQFQGQWVDQDYNQDDIVIRETNPELDDGRKAGTYHALEAVETGDPEPGAVTGVDLVNAAGTAVIGTGASSGVVTAIGLTNPGKGYKTAPPVTIDGDGSGATAHATVNSDGTITLSLDSGGTGYTSATVGIGSPGIQKWEDFAKGKWDRLTFRIDKQQIIFDVGRDSPNNLSIKIIKDMTDSTPGTSGMIDLDVGALLAITGAGDYHIRPVEWEVCIAGTPKHAIFLSTDAY